ncbi:MAG: hypothetical protein IIA72_22005 [Proteobacteria bacterium]|nr:hypothetical protein [Pseudomonadota bacterium]
MDEAKLDLSGSICPPFGRSLRTDRRLKLEFHGGGISSDGGLFPYRAGAQRELWCERPWCYHRRQLAGGIWAISV